MLKVGNFGTRLSRLLGELLSSVCSDGGGTRGVDDHGWSTTSVSESRAFTKDEVELICRNAVRAQLISSGIIDNSAYVVVAGPANTYAHYITTREEYAVQRYEGASTIFGPCELTRVFLFSC